MNPLEIQNRFSKLSKQQKKLLEKKIQPFVISKKEIKRDQLIAYVVKEDSLQTEELKSYLTSSLPDFMIPSKFIFLNELPLLPNGKIDYSKLPEPSKRVLSTAGSSNNLSENERKLIAIWKEVLGLGQIGKNENFFEIGGDSILSIQVISKAKEKGIILSPNSMFEYQTVSSLNHYIDTASKKWDSLIPIRASGHKTPIYCIHSQWGQYFFYNPLVENLPRDRPVIAIQPIGLEDSSKLHNSIEEMASFYKGEIKKFQPKGPYQFIGFCFNNAICIELAYLLASEGDQVQLFIIDSAPPAKKLSLGKRVMNLAKQGGFKLIARKLKQKLASNPPNKSLVDDLAIYDKMPSLAKHYYKLYQKYERKAFKAEVILLRSSQNVNIPGKISHVRNWAELAINGIKQEVVEGDHRDLFNEPEVQELAQKISKHLF